MRASHALLLPAMLGSSQVSAAPSLTDEATIGLLMEAIEKSDGERFSRIDSDIDYLPEWKTQMISVGQALDLLAGCNLSSKSVDGMNFTNLEYRCATRRKLSCTTGNLTVMVYDDRGRTEVGLSEDRILGKDCPRLPVPPSPEAP